MNGWLLSVGAIVLVACSEVAPTPTEELVAELRAWRRQQQAVAANQPSAPVVDAAAARAVIAESLQPLREVLTDLSGRQQELQDRQVALTQELQRWSQLLVESVQVARSDESKAMVARLQQLEQSLREQDQRHREVEGLMERSLLRTAEQLEAFLRQVGGGSPPAPGGHGDEAAREAALAAPRPGRRLGLDRWGWFLLVTMAAGAGWWFVHRARQRPPPADPLVDTGLVPEPPAAGAGPLVATANPVALAGGLVPANAGAPEIWAAAALLGEAVGRLRRTPPAAAPASVAPVATEPVATEPVTADPAVAEPVTAEPVVAAATPPNESPLPDDEWFVIEGLGAGEPVPPAAAPAPGGPFLLQHRLPTLDLARATAELPRVFATEPAVLQRPAPMVAAVAGGVQVTFALLPGTPAGERSRIEQRLREALR